MTTQTSTLASKIAAASKDVGGKLNPDKRNLEQKYDYISADKILSICGQALAEQGIMIAPSIRHEAVEPVDRAGGKARYDATVEFTFLVTDGTTEIKSEWIGRGSDYSVPDKALYKAITSGHKYFLSKLLNVGAGNEDGEHDAAPERQTLAQAATDARVAAKPAIPRQQPVAATVEPLAEVEFQQPAKASIDSLRVNMHELGQTLYGKEWEAKRHDLAGRISEGRTQSSKELTDAEIKRMNAGMAAKLATRDAKKHAIPEGA